MGHSSLGNPQSAVPLDPAPREAGPEVGRTFNPSHPQLARGHTAAPLSWPGLITASLMLMAALTAIAIRGVGQGVWLDDGWSLYLSDPTLSVGQLAQHRWLSDVHPPLYSLLASLARRGFEVAGGLETGRSMNMLALAAALGAVLWLARGHASTRAFTLGTLVLVCSSYFFVRFVRDFRVYGCLMLASLCFATFLLAYVSDALANVRSRALVRGGLFVSALALANLHYFGSLLVGLQLSAAALLLGWLARRKAAIELCGMLSFALLPVMLWLSASIPHLGGTLGGGFWIVDEGSAATGRMLANVAIKLCSNPLAWLLAAVGLVRLMRLGKRASAAGAAGATSALLLALSLALGPLLLVAITLVVHRFHPLLQDRYLTVVAGPLCASLSVLAIAAAGTWTQLPAALRVLGLVALASVTVAQSAWMAEVDPPRHRVRFWDDSARFVRDAQQRCLDEAVPYAGPRPTGAHTPLTVGVQLLAARNGFRVGDSEVARSTQLAASERCPVALWLVHLPEKHPTDAAALLASVGFRAGAPLRVRDFGAAAVLLRR